MEPNLTPTILVLGRNGQVARELAKVGAPQGHVLAFAGREDFDLGAGADPRGLLDRYVPVAVINAAAYTAVDKAETDRDAAFALNRDAPAAFARACADRDIPFVHFSTDYVFDGLKPDPYVEDDPIAPRSVYGLSKAEGEALVTAAGGRAAILRTAWVYSAFGSNFVKTMLRLAETRDALNVVADQQGRPTWAEDCALGALHVAGAMMAGEAKATGIFHLSGAGDATWADFAEAIFEESAARGGKRPTVGRITTADYPTPAQRPANSRLDCGKIERDLGFKTRSWRDSLAACFNEMRA